ncbi:MAG TPA: metallophosphoesterase [Pirellulales bacterium]|nr:metallophosphoesterase [Pirellulales bacterium]
MLQRPFRFLHAADLHLDRPCQTAIEAPDHLIDLLIDGPQQAAAKVFDSAIDRQVDFVLLAGDVIDPHRCAPRDLLFLAEQFQRLADHRISVYWAGGPIDSLDHWPTYVSWPSNVHRFSHGRTERHRYQIAGMPVCEIIGCGHDPSEPPRPYQFGPSDDDLFSIALVHADWNARSLGEIGMNYWALGGSHQRSTPLEAKCVAHVAGSPQGRCSRETGPHGCTIVAVDEHRHVHLTPLSCDMLQWLAPRLSQPETADRHELERLLHERAEQLLAESPGVTLLVKWHVACQGPLQFALRHGALGTELISKLRQEFGRLSFPVWTLDIEADLPAELPSEWFGEETLRGDFLRAVQRCAPEFLLGQATQPSVDHASATFDNDPASLDHVPESLNSNDSTHQPLVLALPSSAADLVSMCNLSPAAAEVITQQSAEFAHPEGRRRLLREVAWLAVDLLSPAEAAQ